VLCYRDGQQHKTVIYARVSTRKQKQDLENQIEMLKTFCYSNGWTINAVFSDIASGISFKDRKDFFAMLDLVASGQIERVCKKSTKIDPPGPLKLGHPSSGFLI
jgi:putative resolvase